MISLKSYQTDENLWEKKANQKCYLQNENAVSSLMEKTPVWLSL